MRINGQVASDCSPRAVLGQHIWGRGGPSHRRRKGSVVGGTMASAEHEPITGVWGQSPQRGPGAEPLVSGSGGEAPAESESILVIGCPTEPANLAFSKNVLWNFVTRNKVLNHCRVIDAIQKVFMNVQSHNRIQTFGRHG